MLAGTPAACTSGAAVEARAYPGGGLTDWFLPSKDELNVMCNYSRNPTSPAAPEVPCTGAQNGAFISCEFVAYGFGSDYYWSSSQYSASQAWFQGLGDGVQSVADKFANARVRPVRAF
jgi:hypothetical protein